MNRLQAAEQLRRALQMFAVTLTDDQAMEVATVYPVWESGKTYTAGTILRHGQNGVGDPQLYRVVQEHTSQADWLPEATPALYTAIGLTSDAYTTWSSTLGAHDAFNTGDIVDYKGILYKSLIDGNVYSPDEYPAGWEVVV